MTNLLNIPWLTESIKKCTIKYLIDRYLGHYLYEELDLSQFDLNVFQGIGSFERIPFNVDAINQAVSPYFPLKFLEGFVNQIELNIPWKSLWTESCSIRLDGIKLNCCKMSKCSKQDSDATSILSKSMMTSSMEMAEEILQQESRKYEGLEKFAQLINSIIRRAKLSADNTVIKLIFPKKSEIGQEIELRIDHIKCEEEEITLDNTKNDEKSKQNSYDLVFSDVVTKRITIEGIEVLINNVLVTKIYGKNTFKIRFQNNHVDMEAYLGSYIFAILNVDQINIIQMFLQMMDDNSAAFVSGEDDLPKERMMTEQDYRRIQELLHIEKIPPAKINLMSDSPTNSLKNKSWAMNDLNDDEFMPFDLKDKKKSSNSDEQNAGTLLTLSLKIPGIMLCLISHDDDEQIPQFNEMPMIDNLQTFIGINMFLNDMLHDYSHFRFLASNLCFEMKKNQIQFSCINISSYEYHQGVLNNLLWVRDSKTDVIMPSVRFKRIDQTMTLTLAPTSIRLDPTIIERHPKFFSLFLPANSLDGDKNSNHSNDSNPNWSLNIECDQVEVEFFFPVANLSQERDTYSRLHDEVLNIDFKNIGLQIEPNSGELLCKSVTIDLRIDEKRCRVFHSNSDQRNIKIYYSTLNLLMIDGPFDKDILITEMNSMQESVNFLHSSAINQDQNNDSPFQIKRNVFGEQQNYEQIITPGDCDHCAHYMANNRELTKFYCFISAPYGQLFFENKFIFELIYNRLVNDLILWTPFFKSKKSLDAFSTAMNIGENNESDKICDQTNIKLNQFENSNQQQQNIYFSCKKYGDSDDSMSGSLLSETSYHSVMVNSNIDSKSKNDFFLEIDFESLDITFHSQSKEKHNLFLKNFSFGVVAGQDAESKTIICLTNDNLIYKVADKPLIIKNSYLNLNSGLNLAIEIVRERQDFKRIKLAAQLRNCIFVELALKAFEDLWEFVNVRDEEILGYICPKVAVELHVDVIKSGISFENLKERTALLHFEDIYLTSMVVENTNQTILRFFIEDAMLCFRRNKYSSDDLKNFISVIDSGIIDINIKISKNGQIEWKCSNNEINLKVCYDSLATLCEFLQSLANQNSSSIFSSKDADLQNEKEKCHIDEPNEVPFHTQSSTMRNDDLLADAMFECSDNESQEFVEKNYSNNNEQTDRNCDCDNNKMDESKFLILGVNDVGSGINTTKQPEVRTLIDEPIKIVENYFKITHYNAIPEMSVSTIARYLWDRMSLKINLYAGKDFDDEQDKNFIEKKGVESPIDAISQINLSLKNERSKSEQKVRFHQNSIHWENIDLISTKDPQKIKRCNQNLDNHLSFRSMGGTKREIDTYVVFNLKKIRILFDRFSKDHSMSWMFLLTVEELEIIDKVSVSKINKMLYEYCSETLPRRRYSSMFSIRVNCFRNFQDIEEADLNVSLKPLRINVDQDTLLFLMDFFNKLNEILAGKLNSVDCASNFTSNINENIADNLSNSVSSSNNSDSDAIGDCSENDSIESVTTKKSTIASDAIFIKSFTFWPDVPIRLDYHGKHIDLKQGALPGIALGLAQLNQSELYLKKIVNKHGILGFDRVLLYAIDEWGKDIKRNQLPSILGGFGPMHSFIQLFQGIRDLFWIPIDQYRRDHRIVRGIQKGAYSFSISTTMATLELANRLVSFIQSTAQFAHDVVTPPTLISNQYNQLAPRAQPRDIREGFTTAYAVLREGFSNTVRGMMNNSNLRSNDRVAVISQVVRHIPSTIFDPLIHLTQATSSVLVGMRNQLTPEARKDDQEKYKNANEW
ncbi:hypothetical protein NH340_JMT00766 [Sarcoptes scabiei]|nr:hypothetical protein NH340_JMT00766 [Sarcoptes scabiei]